MNKELKELEKTLKEIHKNIVDKATPSMYFSGEFDTLVEECFNSENGIKLNMLIDQIGDNKELMNILEKCNNIYEKALTEKFYNCFAEYERD